MARNVNQSSSFDPRLQELILKTLELREAETTLARIRLEHAHLLVNVTAAAGAELAARGQALPQLEQLYRNAFAGHNRDIFFHMSMPDGSGKTRATMILIELAMRFSRPDHIVNCPHCSNVPRKPPLPSEGGGRKRNTGSG